MYLKWEPLGKGKREWQGKGEGGSVYSQPGIRVNGIRATTQRRDSKQVRGEFKE